MLVNVIFIIKQECFFQKNNLAMKKEQQYNSIYKNIDLIYYNVNNDENIFNHYYSMC